MASSRRATRMTEAIGQFRAGLVMMQNAVKDVEDASRDSKFSVVADEPLIRMSAQILLMAHPQAADAACN